jgi:opacity protein-like surface antigen
MRLLPFAVLAALAPGAASAADFSGTWKIDNLFNGSSSNITCTIVQAGDALTGSCKPELPGIAASSLTGAVDGSNAKWGYDVVFNGNAARVDYVAELAADGTFKGSLLRNGSPSPITGVKQ